MQPTLSFIFAHNIVIVYLMDNDALIYNALEQNEARLLFTFMTHICTAFVLEPLLTHGFLEYCVLQVNC